MGLKNRKAWIVAAVAVTAVALAACGGAAAPTEPEPAATTAVAPIAPNIAGGPTPTAPNVTGESTPIPTGAPAATSAPAGVVSAQDSMTLVINEEPLTMNPFPSQGGIAAAPGKVL
jgi:hypothetical protein